MKNNNDTQCKSSYEQVSPSIYTLLSISETSSEEELIHAYEEEMHRLCSIVPANCSEEKLLANKKEELTRVFEQPENRAMSQRIQEQYQKREKHAVRMYSFFPIGFIGLILRLLDSIIGQGGCCDSCMQNCTNSLDRGFCSCSCCADGECCINDIYDCLISSTICSWTSKCYSCYDNAGKVRMGDMVLSIMAILSGLYCIISGFVEGITSERRLQKERRAANQRLDDLETAVQKRNELLTEVIDCYDRLKTYHTDIRPLISFLSTLPEASERFAAMAQRINQPDSFLADISSECEKMQSIRSEIQNVNEIINQLTDSLRDEYVRSLFLDEGRYLQIMQEADEDLLRNNDYRRAMNYELSW